MTRSKAAHSQDRQHGVLVRPYDCLMTALHSHPVIKKPAQSASPVTIAKDEMVPVAPGWATVGVDSDRDRDRDRDSDSATVGHASGTSLTAS